MALSLAPNGVLNKNRYRLYREHKYLFYVFTELLQWVSKVDFSLPETKIRLKTELAQLEQLLKSHADYEEGRIHIILRRMNSPVCQEAEHQHQDQTRFFQRIQDKINQITINRAEEIHFLSYEIYLDLRNFFNENLSHFDYEERVIMPEIQRIASDEEIREIDRISYRQMTPQQMIHMMKTLFPHMNKEDKMAFLKDIQDCEPNKFEPAWKGIRSLIEENERNYLDQIFNI